MTWDTKDILSMDDYVLIMTYKSLATRSLKHDILDKTWVFEDDCVVKMGLSILSIWGDWLKEWGVIKSLAKIVEILEEFPMISYMHLC